MRLTRGVEGVLGGTFDPVHHGHLALAEQVAARVGLPRVRIVPSARPPHKTDEEIGSWDDRVAMVRLALEGRPRLVLDTIEGGRDGRSYTIDTLRELRAAGIVPVFLVGMDALVDLPSWREHDALLREFDLLAAERDTAPVGAEDLAPEIRERLVDLDDTDDPVAGASAAPIGSGGRVFRTRVSPPAISSREIRRHVAVGRSIDRLVPPGVARYIHDRGLYRSASRVAGPQGGPTLRPDISVCVEAALEKKAEDVVVLDLRGKSDVTDYFVVCHGTNERQVVAIADEIERKLREVSGLKPAHVEGRRTSDWVLMDYIDLVVHVFLEERRSFYRLETLWGDAPRLEIPANSADAIARD